jgi:hypothetical protein
MAVLGASSLRINSATLGSQSGSAPMFAARAWVNFNGETSTIRGDGNVSSVFRISNGTHRVTFTTPMPDANYIIFGGANINRNPAKLESQSTTSFTYSTTTGADSTSESDATLSTVGVIR